MSGEWWWRWGKLLAVGVGACVMTELVESFGVDDRAAVAMAFLPLYPMLFVTWRSFRGEGDAVALVTMQLAFSVLLALTLLLWLFLTRSLRESMPLPCVLGCLMSFAFWCAGAGLLLLGPFYADLRQEGMQTSE